MTAIERNIASLNANGWWVAIGPMQGGFVMAVAIREDALLTKRAGDTISEAVSILSRDLKDCPPTAAPDIARCEREAGYFRGIVMSGEPSYFMPPDPTQEQLALDMTMAAVAVTDWEMESELLQAGEGTDLR
jgi:hypothetical protein